MPSRPAVLIIAGSDSSAGAGLERDLRVLHDHQTEARVAVTAVSAQCHQGVMACHALPASLVREQIMAASMDECVGAIKVGMLANREIVQAVAEALDAFPGLPLVLDPVLASSSGTALLDLEGRQAMLELLCPRATLLTPNLGEAAILLGQSAASSDDEVQEQARALRDVCGSSILLKGGHALGAQAIDTLAEATGTTLLVGARLRAQMRGTGCALSTAIAVQLLRGLPLEAACHEAKRYVRTLLAAAES
jgi:hydroxymethylpyrimidine/phosphomethylpyrimidine kinase